MRILFWLIVMLMSSSSLFAHTQHPSIEAYSKLPEVSLVVISPSAKRLAYRDTANNNDIMTVIDVENNSVLGAVDVSEVQPNNAYFIDENRLIFVVSSHKRIKGFKGRHTISAAYVYNLSSNKMHQLLTAGYGIYKGQTELGNIIGISADHRYAFMPAYKNLGSYNLYKVDLDKKRKPRIHMKGSADTIDFFLDENGKVLARERYNNEDDLHLIEARIDDEWVTIFEEKTPYRTKNFTGLTQDKKNLVMISQDSNHQRWAYFTLSLAEGKISKPLFSHDDKDIEHVLTDIRRVVHGVQYSGFSPSYEFFDEHLNARLRGIKHAMPDSNFIINDYTPDWQSMIVYRDGKHSSGDYLLYQNSALSVLAAARPDIPGSVVNPVNEYRFTARDGLVIPTLLTSPAGLEAKKLPAIILPHGGPESYDKRGFDWLTQYFSNRGFLVIQPQFRGSSGFGHQHLNKGRGEWGRKMQDDLTDAIVDLSQKGIIDSKRVCIVGASYGGYAALAGASFTPDRYQCAISINGVSDVKAMLRNEKKDYGSDHWVVSYWQDVIAKGDVKNNHLEQISPINFVEQVKIPILLIHSERDEVVPVQQSEAIYEQLKAANKTVTFVELEKGDHYLNRAEHRKIALKAIDHFLKIHM